METAHGLPTVGMRLVQSIVAPDSRISLRMRREIRRRTRGRSEDETPDGGDGDQTAAAGTVPNHDAAGDRSRISTGRDPSEFR